MAERAAPVTGTRHGTAVALLFAIALILRLAYLPLVVHLPFNDMADYLDFGASLARGEGLGDDYHYPLYGYFLAGFIRLYPADPQIAIRVVQAVIGAGIPVAIAAIATHLFSRRAGLLAGGIAALYPDCIMYCALETPETVYLFLLTAFFVFAVPLVEGDRRWRTVVPAGILLGLLPLAKSLTVPLFALVPLLVLLRRDRHTLLWPLAVLLTLALLLAAPYWYRNHRVYGGLNLTSPFFGTLLYKGNHPGTNYESNYPELTPALRCYAEVKPVYDALALRLPRRVHPVNHGTVSAYLLREAQADIAAAPGTFLYNTAAKIGLFFFRNRDWFLYTVPHFGFARGPFYDTLVYGLLLFAVAGYVRVRRRPGAWLIIGFVAATALAVGITVYLTRYRLPIIPFAIAGAAGACLHYPRAARAAGLTLLLLALLTLAQYRGLDDERVTLAKFFVILGERKSAERYLDTVTTPAAVAERTRLRALFAAHNVPF